MREKYQQEIKNRVDSFENGYAFTTIDFLDITGTDSVNKALSRLNEDGHIRRVIQGVYDKPVYSSVIKEYGAPDINSVAEALARKFNWTIAPAGNTALNYLHMSTQVPNNWIYISDGPYREYKIGPYKLEFKHCANKEISGRSKLTIIAIQALKAIGKDNVHEEDKERLKLAIKNADTILMLKESRTAAAWIYRIMEEVCK